MLVAPRLVNGPRRRPPLAAVLILALAAAGVACSAASASELGERLDTMFAAAYPADEPGAAVRVQRGDEILLRAGYGMADLELGVPVAPEMIFRLGSITKQFTAVLVVMLAAEGKLDLDAPLGRHLPDYPEPGAAATVRQVLTHTAGIPSYTSDPEFWKTSALDQDLDELIATWQDEPLDFEPGTDWSYSNSGYVVLGKLIETVGGGRYAELLDERICRPLGLERTSYGDPRMVVPGRVRGYERESDGYRNAAYLSMTLPHAAGSLLSSVDDMVAWGKALFGGDRLLSERWRRELLTPAVLADGRRTAYACGLTVQEYAGHRVVSHGGGINGFVTFVAYAADDDLTVVVLSNNTGSDPTPQTLAQRALALALDAPLDERPRVELPPEVLEEYAGVYRLDADEETVRVLRYADGGLTSQRSGGTRVPVRFSARDAFYFEDSFTTGRVERDGEGRVTGLAMPARFGPEERWRRTDEPIPVREPIQLEDLSLLDALVGRYELFPGFVLEVRRVGDTLVAQATGQEALVIHPESESRWFPLEVDAVFEFQGFEDGQADALVLYQGGQELPAPRVE